MPNLSRRGFLHLISSPFAGVAPLRGWAAAEPELRDSHAASRELVLHRERCLAWGGTNCIACYIACPLRDDALVLEQQRPRLDLTSCSACGDCVLACRTVNDRAALDWTTRTSVAPVPPVAAQEGRFA